MRYNPSFHRKSKGKFDKNTNYVAIKGGTKSFLLEDEINELQWIQNETRANLIRKMTNSGVIHKQSWDEPNLYGGLKELGNNSLNSFAVYNFDVIVNGYLNKIKHNDDDFININLPEPPSTGIRHDFVFLEFWFTEINGDDKLPLYGGINNEEIENSIVDSRINKETSRRIQMQWNLRIEPDINYYQYQLGFTDVDNDSNTNINPRKDLDELSSLSFINDNNDKGLFIAGDGSIDSQNVLQTIDGYSYAIPLFIIKRINNGEYNETTNPNGGNDYINENSIPIRPDGKFSNIIYPDQVMDLRNLSAISKRQYDTIYASLKDFEEFKKNINQKIGQHKNKIDYLESYVDLLENRLYRIELDPDLIDTFIYNLDMRNVDYLTPGGNIGEDTGIIESTGEIIPVKYDTKNDYAILYSFNDDNYTKAGSIWINRSDINFLIKNTGSDNISISTSVIEATQGRTGYRGNEDDEAKDSIAAIYKGYFLGDSGSDIDGGSLDGENDYEFDLESYDNKIELPHHSLIKDSEIVTNLDGSIVYNKNVDYVINNNDRRNGYIEIFDDGEMELNETYKVVYKYYNEFLFIYSTNNDYGDIGQIYIRKNNDGFTVYNSGIDTGVPGGASFEYVLIKVQQLKNVFVENKILNGDVGEVIDNVKHGCQIYTTPVILQDSQLSDATKVGEISVLKPEKNDLVNNATIYNSGSSIGTVDCLVFKSQENIEI